VRSLASLDDTKDVANALGRAIKHGDVKAHYQPALDLRDGSLVGIEALARWHEPGFGSVSPTAFVPAAEQEGLMLDLTHCVLDQVAGCSARGAGEGKVLPLSVNVSAASVNDELVALLSSALDIGRLEPQQLTVELTETTLLPDDDHSRRLLEDVHRSEIRLSIDDFGIGWSSLAYLADLPVSELKIDRSFVQRLPESYEIRCIVGRMIELARDLGVDVVAEGIETEVQRTALLELGCWRAQGFLIARPMPESALWHWLDRVSFPAVPRSRSAGVYRAAPVDEPLRILLVEDHQMVAEGIVELVGAEPDLDVVGVEATVAGAADAATRLRPDVVLMDYRLPDGDGVEATRLIRAAVPTAAVVMVTSVASESVLLGAIDAGCAAFVLKDGPVQDVIDATRAAGRGDAVIAPSLLARLLPRLRRSSASPVTALTDREQQVLELLVEGLSSQAIADRLFLSMNTVRNHVQNVLVKLGSHSRLEAVATAVRTGLVDRA
jgi:EAL domain-containing protein (putative c-di-GMP-specific phosphodiesterase class I)/DNA-binding NarL/FixJ family response regulator